MTTNIRLGLAIGAAATVAFSGCGLGITSSAKKKAGPAAVGPADECSQPVVHDAYIGYKVGKPADWKLDATGGTIVVKKDAKGRELALVYPVVLKPGQTPRKLYDAYTGVLDATARADGGGLDFQVSSEQGDRIKASVSGTFADTKIKGRAQVAKAGRQTIFSAYWAPAERLGAEEDTLSSVVACYGIESGKPMKVHKGPYFTASVPVGWQVTGETTNGIDIAAPGDQGSVNFAFVTNIPGTGTPEGFRDWVFGSFGLQGTEITATQDLGSLTDPTGAQWSVQASEFESSLRGESVHGVITIGVGNSGYGTFAGLASVRAAKSQSWNRLAGALAAVQDSVQMGGSASGGGGGGASAGAGVSLPANNPNENPLTSSYEYRSQVEDKTSQDWQEATMGFDNVESPTTGDQYQVPLNSYDPTGSEGAGYYRGLPDGSSEKLVESEP